MSNILITGGTGSLGQALVKKLLTPKKDVVKYKDVPLIWDSQCNKVIVYSRSEHKQEEMCNALSETHDVSNLRFFLGDIRDRARLDTALRGNAVSSIINAAALKVVPKGEYDPIEFVKTNIYGVQNIIEAAAEHGVYKVMQVSTDKAVAPINLYGATKLTAEKMILAANNMYGYSGPVYGFVRYGNVVGSSGSVVPLFRKQYANRQPFTITDPRMTRFWITLDEASDFVLDSLELLGLDDTRRVSIPDMPATNIVDVARAIGGKKYPINITGTRPGEKIHEIIALEGEGGALKNSEDAPRMSVAKIRKALKRI